MTDSQENGADVQRADKRARTSLIDQFGGACQGCGYNRCRRALQFHHKDASEKAEWSKSKGGASNHEVRAHPERFILLCANCHFEEHERLDAATRVIAECLHCGKTFETKACLLENNKGKYCSKPCQRAYWSKTAPDRIADRFWAKVDKSGDCWLWTGYKQKGTAMFLMASPDGVHKPQTAHRTSWILHNGPVPEGMEVLRTCGNSACVNPAHLALGNRADVGMNRMRLGRTTQGERSASVKLNEEQVREIRRRVEAGGVSRAELGRDYGVAIQTISDIINRRRWRHI
jgi:hypothetical protein